MIETEDYKKAAPLQNRDVSFSLDQRMGPPEINDVFLKEHPLIGPYYTMLTVLPYDQGNIEATLEESHAIV